MQALDKLKSEIMNASVRKYFDPELLTRVSCDASSYGLGAVLEQFNSENWYSIAYASRSLSLSEKIYCQLEKECLSALFSCEKFHEYLWGIHFSVGNDNLPSRASWN